MNPTSTSPSSLIKITFKATCTLESEGAKKSKSPKKLRTKSTNWVQLIIEFFTLCVLSGRGKEKAKFVWKQQFGPDICRFLIGTPGRGESGWITASLTGGKPGKGKCFPLVVVVIPVRKGNQLPKYFCRMVFIAHSLATLSD